MKSQAMLSYCFLAATLLVLLPSQARAQNAEDCGNFDFTEGINCKIELEGGCSAQCTPLRFEAACTGACTVEAETQCVDSCGPQCIATCDPSLLDCFAGCHGECDAPTQELCEANGTRDDCAEVAIAECDIHCTESCEVPPSDCQEHCTRCCTGSCTTQVNFDCNLSCFADLSGGCEAQCTEPNGALFCNDQYVGASDVEACILYLADQGVEVDVSARGSVTCDLSGCTGEGGGSGCSTSRGGAGAVASTMVLLGLCMVWRRRRHRA